MSDYREFRDWFYSEPHRRKYSEFHPAFLAAHEAWEDRGARVAELEAALAQQACRAVANYPGSMEFLGTRIYDRRYDVGRTTDTTGGE